MDRIRLRSRPIYSFLTGMVIALLGGALLSITPNEANVAVAIVTNGFMALGVSLIVLALQPSLVLETPGSNELHEGRRGLETDLFEKVKLLEALPDDDPAKPGLIKVACSELADLQDRIDRAKRQRRAAQT